MSKLALLISFIIIIAFHYLALTFLYEKKVPKPIVKPQYQKVSVRFVQQKIPVPTQKAIEKKVEKSVQQEQKKLFKKTIKNEAKRKLVKKVIKKQKPKKKIVKQVEKKPLKKVEKIVKTEPIKKVEKVIKKIPPLKAEKTLQIQKKAAVKSLEKFKKYKEDYSTALRAAIDRNKKYPIASKRLEEEGIVMVSFRVLKTGLFKNIQIKDPSGKRRLDKSALKAVQLTAKFKPFTEEIQKEFIDFNIPIKFELN